DLATGNDRTKTFLDVKRNCHYKITITKVKSYGYPTEAEALKNSGSNLEYEIVITDENDNYTTSNGQYALSTDKKAVELFDGAVTPEALKFALQTENALNLSTAYIEFVDASKTAHVVMPD
ncbi:MAG: hypothetical protein PHD11_06990, partial [Bacteroidales bacterium]|nr:hypothetical protein [Bacteroidales bacterium]MDD4670608.1 hypothetical protein [Bacteroidales bacterium]